MPNPGNPIVIVDDRDPAVKYAGQWEQAGINEEFRGTTSTSRTLGSTATFTFNGTKLAVFGTFNPDPTTTMTFSIDKTINGQFKTPATLPATISGPAALHQKLYESPDLPAGIHSLVITQGTTSTNPQIFLDYITYNPTPDSASTGLTYLLDDGDAAVKYEGFSPTTRDRNLLGTLHQPAAAGAKITLPFEGTAISIFANVPRRLIVSNMATITIDGGPPTNFAPPIQIIDAFTFNQEIFKSPKLTQNNHTLVLTTVGNDALQVDYFAVTPGEITRPTPVPSSTSSSTPPASQSTTTTIKTATQSQTPTNSTTPTKSSSSSNVAAIAGGAIGGIIALALLFALFMFWRKKRIQEQWDSDGISLNGGVTPFGAAPSHHYPPSQPMSYSPPATYSQYHDLPSTNQPAQSLYGGSNHAGYGANRYPNEQSYTGGYPAAYPGQQSPQQSFNSSGSGTQAARMSIANPDPPPLPPLAAGAAPITNEKDPRYRPGPAYLYQQQQPPPQSAVSAEGADPYDGYDPGPSELPYAGSRPLEDKPLPNPHESRPPPNYTLHDR